MVVSAIEETQRVCGRYMFARAAITKNHTLGGLNNKNV